MALFAAAGCVYYPGISAKDGTFFSEQPYIAAKTGGYALAWRYGSLGCVFFPTSKVTDGGLQFSLDATTSSHCSGPREAAMPITNPEQVRTLESKGAYWLEPDGSKLRLEVRFR